jgi:hypothetical protein
MKQINVWFEDKEHEELNKIKEDHGGNWHDFLMDVIRKYGHRKENENRI